MWAIAKVGSRASACAPRAFDAQAEACASVRPIFDAFESEPAREGGEFRPQVLAQLRRRLGILVVDRDCFERARIAARFGIDARRERVAVQERQHVVAVHALCCRRVDFDAVVEVENAPVAAAFPDQRIERREQRPGIDRGAERCVSHAMIRQLLPTLDADGSEIAMFDEFVDALVRVDFQAKVVTQIRRVATPSAREAMRSSSRFAALRRASAEPGSPARKRARANRRSARSCAGGRGQGARPKQILERDFHVAPAPPAAPGAAMLGDVAAREGSALLHFAQDGVDERGFLACDLGHAAPRSFAARRARHAPAKQRMQGQRDERCFMAPILEEFAPAFLPHQPFEQLDIVRAQPREQREVVRPHDHVDRVDLHQTDAFGTRP